MPDDNRKATGPSGFSKEQILRSSQFSGCEKDLLTALLAEDKTYTLDKCREILKKEERRVIQ